MKKKIITEILSVCVFLGFIYTLSIANIFTPDRTFSDNENRSLTQVPDFSPSNIFSGDFDTQFESWFADQFFQRDRWIEMKASVRKDAGAIENNSVYFGHDGRLISQFTAADEKILNNNISYINEFTKDTGLKANIMLVPGAAYGERKFLPMGAWNLDEAQMIRKIGKKFPDQNYIDLTDRIGNGNDYYFHTDHHWNEKGAEAGYEEICRTVLNKDPQSFTYRKVADDFHGTMYSKSGAFWTKGDPIYEIIPARKNKVTVTYDGKKKGNSLFVSQNLKKKDKYTYYADGNHAIEDIHTSVRNGKTALIVKDSYAHILLPYLAQEYSEIRMVDLRYYHQAVSDLIKDKDNTDLYFIYSLETFCSDTGLAQLF